MLSVNKIIDGYLEKRQDDRGDWKSKHLWASDVGKCPRKAIIRLSDLAEASPVETRMLQYMQIGLVLEDDTRLALEHEFGDRLDCQLSLRNDVWSGKPDFVIGHGTNDVTIIEHKVTGENAWSNKALPRTEHVGQLLLYKYLYKKIYNVDPKCYLYYRAWGHYAEFEITRDSEGLLASGEVDGVADIFRLKDTAMQSIQELEDYFYSDELPPVLKRKNDGCTFMGKPSCPYYDYCWGR